MPQAPSGGEPDLIDPLSLDGDEFLEHMGITVPDDKESEGNETEVATEEAATEEAEPGAEEATDEATEDGATEESEAGEESAEEEEAATEEAEEAEEPPKRATDFRVFEGEDEVELPAGLTITFKADGKERKLPVDRVVRLAQNGFYNERLQSEVKEVRERLPGLQKEAEETREESQRLRRFAQQLLEDDDFLLDQRARYIKANSPEEQARRYRSRVEALEAERREAVLAAAREEFVDNELFPKFAELRKQYPEVTEEELLGRWGLITADLEVGGRVPQKHWKTLTSLVESDLAPWVAQVHERRSQKVSDVRREGEAKVRKAKVATTVAKRTLARAVKPVTSRTAAPSSAKKRPAESADDAVEEIIRGLGL